VGIKGLRLERDLGSYIFFELDCGRYLRCVSESKYRALRMMGVLLDHRIQEQISRLFEGLHAVCSKFRFKILRCEGGATTAFS
jgi:hypothetical protein